MKVIYTIQTNTCINVQRLKHIFTFFLYRFEFLDLLSGNPTHYYFVRFLTDARKRCCQLSKGATIFSEGWSAYCSILVTITSLYCASIPLRKHTRTNTNKLNRWSPKGPKRPLSKESQVRKFHSLKVTWRRSCDV